MIGVGFALVAGVMLLGALATVTTGNMVRAVYWLALTLAATAGLYILLDAGFLAGVQVLTYVGGIVTLMIFGVMVTRRVDGGPIPSLGADGFRALVVAVGTFALMASAIVTSHLEDGLQPPLTRLTTQGLARSLLDEYLLAFEAASLLLLAAIVGAVVLARRKDVPEKPAVSALSLPGTRGEQP
jgi:NADH:ubiquinone oxidoreductase subunit 6 (subunit J)